MKNYNLVKLVSACGIVVLFASCNGDTVNTDAGENEAGVNESLYWGHRHPHHDASMESGSEAGSEVGSDSSVDAHKDSSMDAASDATTDSSTGTCSIFPQDNPWNRDVSMDLVDPNSATYMAAMAPTGKIHADFGSDLTYGIPFIYVPATQQKFPATFDYADQSDVGPYPIPMNAPIEGATDTSGDRHVIAIDQDNCKLYELYSAEPMGTFWKAGSGAIFDLKSNNLRPDQWTSADAAGLPIYPGLVRFDEAVTKGQINHALRFTMKVTQNSFIHPATHGASSNTSASSPPMGLRIRLKANFDISSFTGASKAIVVAMKKYGMFLADNGSNWYVSGEASKAGGNVWDDNNISQLSKVPATAFEVVKITTPIIAQK